MGEPQPSVPLYIGPDGSGNHQILNNGVIETHPFESLTPQLQYKAITAAQNPMLAPGTDASIHPWKAFKSLFGGASEGQLMNYGAPPDQAEAVATGQPAAAAPQPAGAPPPAPGQQPPAPLEMAPATPQAPATPPGKGGGGGPGGGGEIDKAEQEKLDAAKGQMELTNTLDADKLAINRYTQKKRDDLRAAYTLQQQAIDKSTQDTLGKMADAADKFAHSSIDPNSYWQNKTLKQRQDAAAAIIASGVGASLAGDQNLALKAYQDAQERDIAAQRYNIEHGKETTEVYKNLVGEFRQAGLDKKTAFDAADQALRERGIADTDNMILAHGNQASAIKFKQDTAGIRENHADKRMSLAKDSAAIAAANATTRHTNLESDQLQQQAGLSKSLQAGQDALAKGYKWEQLPPDQQAAVAKNASANDQFIDKVGIANRKVEPEERETIKGIQNMDDARARLRQIVNAPGYATSPAMQKAAAQQASFIRKIAPTVFGTKAKISQGADEALGEIIENPGMDLRGHAAVIDKELGLTTNDIYQNLLHGKGGLGVTEFKPSAQTDKQASAFGAVAQ